MKIQTALIVTLLLLTASLLPGQAFHVEDFAAFRKDVSARENPISGYPETAIIKVRTGIRNMKFYGDKGILKIEERSGEYWLWVPALTSSIDIDHDDYEAQTFYIDQDINVGTVYIMELKSTRSVDQDIMQPVESRRSIITSPSNARIYIDDQYLGRSPMTFKPGDDPFTIRISKRGYDTISIYDNRLDVLKGYDFQLNENISVPRVFLKISGQPGALYRNPFGLELGMLGKSGISVGLLGSMNRFFWIHEAAPEGYSLTVREHLNQSVILTFGLYHHLSKSMIISTNLNFYSLAQYGKYKISNPYYYRGSFDLRKYYILETDWSESRYSISGSLLFKIKNTFLLDLGVTYSPKAVIMLDSETFTERLWNIKLGVGYIL